MGDRIDFARVAIVAGAELRRLRVAAGLTVTDVARRTGSHRPIICRTESGRHAPSVRIIARQAVACGGSALDVTRAIDRELERQATGN